MQRHRDRRDALRAGACALWRAAAALPDAPRRARRAMDPADPSPHRARVRALLRGAPSARLFERTMFVFKDPAADELPPWPAGEVARAIDDAHALLARWPDRHRSTRSAPLLGVVRGGGGSVVYPWAALAREVHFGSPLWRDQMEHDLRLLGGSPHAREIRALEFVGVPVPLDLLVADGAFPSLRRLALISAVDFDFARFAHHPRGASLEHLTLCNQREVTPALLAAILDGPPGRNLASLALQSGCGAPAHLAVLLARDAVIRRLRSLSLFCNELGDVEACALADARAMNQLAWLDLKLNTAITPAGRERLLRAPQFARTTIRF